MDTKNPNHEPPTETAAKLQMPESTAGIITLSSWTMVPTGQTYLYLWAPRWIIVTDKSWPIDGFHSSEHWQLLGLNAAGETVLVIPGCGVKGWCACPSPPPSATCFSSI